MRLTIFKAEKLLPVLSFWLLLSCQTRTGEYQDTPTSGTVSVAIDETFGPVIQDEIDVFESIYRTACIIDIPCPEVKAFNLLMRDSVRMIIATRSLNKEETNYFKNKNIFPKEIKIATDGIALIVHKENPDTLITTGIVRKILNGEIKSWNELCPGSELGSIKVVFDNTRSSTAQYAVKEICNGALSSDLRAMNKNVDVINYVSQTPDAIGIIGVSWISNHQDSKCMGFLNKIRVMGVSKEETANETNSFQPYQAYLATGQYPYTRNIYIIIADPRTGLTTGFASFIASDRGQRIILKSGILPATQPLRLIQVNDNL
jgi:phosphate transport system substrate-binding protein